MGMFDTIFANCPECNTVNYFQSKSGECMLSHYEIKNAPDQVMLDANRHTPQSCEQCGKLLFIDIENRVCVLATQEQIEAQKNYIEAMKEFLEGTCIPTPIQLECGCGERCSCKDNDENQSI